VADDTVPYNRVLSLALSFIGGEGWRFALFITKVIGRLSRVFTTKQIDPNNTATDALGRLS
jgi:hypothetical protein